MASQFRVELVGEDEIPALVAIMVPAFAIYAGEAILGNVDTPESIQANTQRHIFAAKEHMDETGRKCAIKCVETTSGNNEIAACAYWLVFDKPRSPENAYRANALMSATWIPEGEQRERALKFVQPASVKRAQWTVGRPHAILMYMATDPAWRRKGAATACVQWGLDLCKELGIMAYLEASPAGAPVYKRLGFEVVDQVECEVDGEVSVFPTMAWWPPGTKDEDKKPLEG
jgi:GNAT superfamily N-acetyltransferase